MHPKSYFVSADGGSMEFIDENGEVVAQAPIPPGRVSVRDYLDIGRDAVEVRLSAGVMLVEPKSGVHRQKYGSGSHHTGANPDFRPTSADRMAREMRLTLNRMQAATARVEARERQLAKVQRVPTAPKPGDGDVIEREAPVVTPPADDQPAVE